MHLPRTRTGRRAASVAIAALAAAAMVAATGSASSAAGNMTPAVSSAASGPEVQPQLISDAQLQALSTTMGGASVLPTTRTVAHWWGSTLDPSDGVPYGYNMVGADPNCQHRPVRGIRPAFRLRPRQRHGRSGRPARQGAPPCRFDR
jgi:hypothetical protein